MNVATLPLIALVVGFTIPFAMLLKHARDLSQAYRVSRKPNSHHLELIVNGKDYSVDLRTINNGGSEKIAEARRELERCA